ncbi:unnamed protein product [Chironomus riparius]|uniref:Uncharacterized protein n=1 Tax=Chironomus riparius TaxID=315576 RepID=A0A9N9RSS9_9DIPT|nr:unnamed protein product [Chironomus riparius]
MEIRNKILLKHAPIFSSINAFVSDCVCFKAKDVILQHDEIKIKLLNLMDKIPGGNSFNDIREKLFAWKVQLNLIYITALKSEDPEEMLGPLVKDALKSRKMSIMGMMETRKALKSTPLTIIVEELTESEQTICPSGLLVDQNDQDMEESKVSSYESPSNAFQNPILKEKTKKEISSLLIVDQTATTEKKVKKLAPNSPVIPDIEDEKIKEEEGYVIDDIDQGRLSSKVDSRRTKKNGMDENDYDDDEDEDGCISCKMFNINEIDLGKKIIIDSHVPHHECMKVSVPSSLLEAEGSYIFGRSEPARINFCGFELPFSPQLLEFRTVTGLIRRRNSLLEKYRIAVEKGQTVNAMTREELLNLFVSTQEEMIKKVKNLADWLDIKAEEQPINELLKNLPIENSSRSKKMYAIEGNVKSLTKLVMDETDLPCVMKIVCLFLQQLILYGKDYTYGKVGLSECTIHSNVKPGRISIMCDRYKDNDKLYHKIDRKTILYIGRYSVVMLIERIAIHIAACMGVSGNDTNDLGQKPAVKDFFNSTGLLYFTTFKNFNPFDAFLFRSVPYVKPDAFSLVLYSLVVYLKVKTLAPCYLCAKLFPGQFSTHLKSHFVSKIINGSDATPCGYECYQELAILLVTAIKKKFKIINFMEYVDILDRILNEIFAISSLYNSIGVASISTSMTNFQKLKGTAHYSESKKTITKFVKLDGKTKEIKKVSNFLRGFVGSTLFKSSFDFIENGVDVDHLTLKLIKTNKEENA